MPKHHTHNNNSNNRQSTTNTERAQFVRRRVGVVLRLVIVYIAVIIFIFVVKSFLKPRQVHFIKIVPYNRGAGEVVHNRKERREEGKKVHN